MTYIELIMNTVQRQMYVYFDNGKDQYRKKKQEDTHFVLLHISFFTSLYVRIFIYIYIHRILYIYI